MKFKKNARRSKNVIDRRGEKFSCTTDSECEGIRVTPTWEPPPRRVPGMKIEGQRPRKDKYDRVIKRSR
jgi:hypothetical protein